MISVATGKFRQQLAFFKCVRRSACLACIMFAELMGAAVVAAVLVVVVWHIECERAPMALVV